ncbi:hypothetical protein KC338_g194 [Hortaea werneckii]|nr:hypothetical protein KC338_g194 [Hortaea werneckii]
MDASNVGIVAMQPSFLMMSSRGKWREMHSGPKLATAACSSVEVDPPLRAWETRTGVWETGVTCLPRDVIPKHRLIGRTTT